MFLTRCEIILGDNLRDKRSPIETHSAIRLQSKKFANKNMNTPKPNNTSTNTLARRAPILVAAASLLLAPCLFAQKPTPEAESAAEKAAASPSDAAAPWVEERFGRPTPDVLHWSVEPAVTKAFEPSGVFDKIMHCGEFTVVSNYGLYWSGEGDPDDSKDMQASVVILKGQQRVFVARGYQFDKFNYDAAKKTLNFKYWTGVQGDGQIVEFTMDFASGTLQPKTRTLSTKDETTLQKGSTSQTSAQSTDLPSNPPLTAKLYNLKFDGGPTSKLSDSLKAQFPGDNVVLSESVARLDMPNFELRNVKIEEIARTIEFLGEGNLSVEVTDNAGSGNVWLIGRKNPAEAAATVKLRSVAAPNLFANEKALIEIQIAADDLEMKRLSITGIMGGAKGVFRGASLKPLPSQGIFVIIGDEEGVAGLENLIQVAEKDQTRIFEELHREAPKMKAVAAPHLFARQERVDQFLEEYRVMTAVHGKMTEYRWNTAGFGEGATAYGAEIHPRPEADLFMIVGNSDAITGLESLIFAAEQLAAAEDAILDTRLTPQQRVEQAEMRAAAKSEARAKEKARLEAKEGKSEE